MKNPYKKGQVQLQDLPTTAITIGITALVLGIMALVITNVDTQTTPSAEQQNLTDTQEIFGNGTLAANNITSNLPLIATIVALAVVLGVVVVAFGRRLLG